MYTVIVDVNSRKRLVVGKYDSLERAVQARYEYLKGSDLNDVLYTPSKAEAIQNLLTAKKQSKSF